MDIEQRQTTSSVTMNSPGSLKQLLQHCKNSTTSYDVIVDRNLRSLSAQFNVETLQNLSTTDHRTIIEIFCTAPKLTSFQVLNHALATTARSEAIKMSFCCSLLQEYLQRHSLATLIFEQCCGNHSNDDKDFQSYDHRREIDDIVTLICGLPTRVANVMQLETEKMFLPEDYVKLITKDVFAALEKCYSHLQLGKNVNTLFVGKLIGRLSLTGYGELFWTAFLPQISVRVMKDYLWSRLCSTVISHVPDQSLDGVLTQILLAAPWYGVVHNLCGDLALNSTKAAFILTNKFLLIKVFDKDIFLQNLIGYLNSIKERKLFQKILKSLLEVWGDSSSMKHISYEQHLYITKAILITWSFASDEDKKQMSIAGSTLLMHGLQRHLEMSTPSLRRLGMIVGESLAPQMFPQVDASLEFEYDVDDEVLNLRSLLVPPAKVTVATTTKEEKTEELVKKNAEEYRQSSEQDDGAQSDNESDDFEPYESANDVPPPKVKAPLYIRECMQGLIARDDPDLNEVCLREAAVLIQKHHSAASEVAVEMCKILLHMENTFSMDDYSSSRHSALTAVTVVNPKEVAEYLCNQFYERDYNVRQRLDMLETLSTAIKELSDPNPAGKERIIETKQLPMAAASRQVVGGEDKSWQEIVAERIKNKTRVFARGRQQPAAPAVANRLASVAGCFFFPLLKNLDRKENTFDLLGKDHFLLSQVVYTLGTVVFASQHLPVAVKMVKAIFEVTHSLKYHPETGVRRALLYTVAMAIATSPPTLLYTEVQSDVTEIRLWLQDVLEHDADTDCCKMASHALALLISVLEQEYKQ